MALNLNMPVTGLTQLCQTPPTRSCLHLPGAVRLAFSINSHLDEIQKEQIMKAYSNEGEIMDSSSEQVTTQETNKAPYETPEVTVMGRVEQHTAILFHGVPD